MKKHNNNHHYHHGSTNTLNEIGSGPAAAAAATSSYPMTPGYPTNTFGNSVLSNSQQQIYYSNILGKGANQVRNTRHQNYGNDYYNNQRGMPGGAQFNYNSSFNNSHVPFNHRRTSYSASTNTHKQVEHEAGFTRQPQLTAADLNTAFNSLPKRAKSIEHVLELTEQLKTTK